MQITKRVAKFLPPVCAFWAILGSSQALIWYGPVVIFSGIYLLIVMLTALAEFEGII